MASHPDPIDDSPELRSLNEQLRVKKDELADLQRRVRCVRKAMSTLRASIKRESEAIVARRAEAHVAMAARVVSRIEQGADVTSIASALRISEDVVRLLVAEHLAGMRLPKRKPDEGTE